MQIGGRAKKKKGEGLNKGDKRGREKERKGVY
jgi:hypothetical protein